MKDYVKFHEGELAKYYYNENGQRHKLIGPAVEYKDGNKTYYINSIYYMGFHKNSNMLILYKEILELTSEYEQYIKQNIKDLIGRFNIKIILYDFEKDQINELPNWLKDLIIL